MSNNIIVPSFFQFGTESYYQIPECDLERFSQLEKTDFSEVLLIFTTPYLSLSNCQQRKRVKWFRIWHDETRGLGYPELQHFDVCPVKRRVKIVPQCGEYCYAFGKEITCESAYDVMFHGKIVKKLPRQRCLDEYHDWLYERYGEVEPTYDVIRPEDATQLSIICDEDGVHISDPVYSFLRESNDDYVRTIDIAHIYHEILRKSPIEPSFGTYLAIGGFSYSSEDVMVSIAMSNGMTRLSVSPHHRLFPFTVVLLKYMNFGFSLSNCVSRVWTTTIKLNGLNSKMSPKQEFDALSRWYDQHRNYVPTVPEKDRSGLLDLLELKGPIYDDINLVTQDRIEGGHVISSCSSYDEFKARCRTRGNKYHIFVPIPAIQSGILHMFRSHYPDMRIRLRTDYNYQLGMLVEFEGKPVLDQSRVLTNDDYRAISAHFKRYIIHVCQSYNVKPPIGFNTMYTISDYHINTPISFSVDADYGLSTIRMVAKAGVVTGTTPCGDVYIFSNSCYTNTSWFFYKKHTGYSHLIGDLRKHLNFKSGDMIALKKAIGLSKLKKWSNYEPIDMLSSLIYSENTLDNSHYGMQKICNLHKIGKIVITYDPPNHHFRFDNAYEPKGLSKYKIKKGFDARNFYPSWESLPITNFYIHDRFGFPVLNPKVSYLYDRCKDYRNHCDMMYDA